MNSGASLATHHSMMRRRGPDEIRHRQHRSRDIPDAPPPWPADAPRFASASRRAGNVACTMQVPCQIFMFSRPGLLLYIVAQIAVRQEEHRLLRAESS